MSVTWFVVIGLASWPLAALLVGLALGRAIGLRGHVRAVPPGGAELPVRGLASVQGSLRRDLVG